MEAVAEVVEASDLQVAAAAAAEAEEDADIKQYGFLNLTSNTIN